MNTEKPTNTPMQNIASLVNHALPLLHAGNCTEQEGVNFVNELTTEIPQLKLDLRLSQIHMEPRLFNSHIQLTQYELMKLTGSLVNYVDAQELCVPTTPVSRVCHQTCHELNELINSLSKQYADSLLKDIYAHEQFRMITAYQLFHGLADLVESLRAHEAEQMLIDIIMSPFRACAAAGADVTLAQLNYLKLLKRQLPVMIKEVEKGAPIDMIMQVMFCALNFNSLTAVQYCIRYIYDQLQTFNGVESRRDFLGETRVRLSFMPPLEKPLALQPELPLLTDQLLHWLDKESERLKQTTPSDPLEIDPQPMPVKPTTRAQIPIGIPNGHHALLTKIQIKANGYICSERRAKRLMPQIFCMYDGKPIGEAAYAKSFKEIDGAAVRGVLEYLEDCIRIAKADYGHLLP
jgi:hypothetical protein